ncbi:hypothetical protein QN277_001926 [Acacia crassicarpa]|uniref:Uncharacterized protein n=1 Tax=Acacia crassicarpa TaxID=499986 RepID=A0AAE1NAM5_9FABA|nr:hypothetical protein QN277_001926 [Acacia crassicarpa]
MNQVHTINQCLKTFYDSSGLKVNHQKTCVFFSDNVNHIRRSELCTSLGFSITYDLGKYLGVPLHHKRVTKESYQFVVNKVKTRLSTWKAKNLSAARRTTLISSVTMSIPGYVMQTSSLPMTTCESLDKYNRKFLWVSTEDKQKIPLVSWDAICKPKTRGGLGLRHAKDQNNAYLMKLGWRLATKREDLWVKVIQSKYNCGNDKLPRINMSNPRSNLWSGIKRTWGKVQDGIKPLANGQIRWRWAKNGQFYVKLAYDSLSNDAIPPNPMWGKIWKLKIPERCKVFTWLVLHKRLLTNASRHKRGLTSDSRCPVCDAEIENLQHVLRDCPETLNLWKSVVPQCLWSKFSSLSFDHWFQWNSSYKDRRVESEEWRQQFILICWWLWRPRNSFVFEGKKISNDTIQLSVDATRGSIQDAHDRFFTAVGRQGKAVEHETRWKPPPEGWVKINTDGAFSYFEVGVACGGVIRDAHGNFLRGFMFKGMEGDSLSAKLWGCLHSLKLAWDLGHRQVILEADSAEAIDLMKKVNHDLHADGGLVEEIRCLMERDWRLEVDHINRWANTTADHLTKAGLSSMTGFHVVIVTNGVLDSLLLKDKG